MAGMQLGTGRVRPSGVFSEPGESHPGIQRAVWWNSVCVRKWCGGVAGVEAGTRDWNHVFGLETASYLAQRT